MMKVIPKNIDIRFNEFCKNCDSCEIELQSTENYAVMPVYSKATIYHVRCKNEKICELWNYRLKEAKNDEDSD